MRPPAVRPLLSLVIALAAFSGALLSQGVAAQYKWTNPDGTVSYGDRPPAEPVKMLQTPGASAKAGSGSADAALPYALSQAAARYPVVLYTGNVGSGECQPCKEGRDFLSKRGIPFSEKQVRSAADVAAFKSGVSSEGSLPVLTVGKEKSVGFESGSWGGLLDAAGYPKSSMLPNGYRQAAAETLTRPAESEGVKQASSTREEARAPRAARNTAPAPAAAPAVVDPNAGSKIRF